jgi:hypothetical protein
MTTMRASAPTPAPGPAAISALLLALLMVLIVPGPAAAQLNILGPCRDGHRWMATTTRGAPVAAYATCEEARPLVIVACGAGGWPELRLAVAAGTPLPAPGEAAFGRLTIDGGAGFDLRLAPAAQLAGGNPILRVQLTEAAVEAMARGARARLEAAGLTIDLHLGASHDVLMLFHRQC